MIVRAALRMRAIIIKMVEYHVVVVYAHSALDYLKGSFSAALPAQRAHFLVVFNFYFFNFVCHSRSVRQHAVSVTDSRQRFSMTPACCSHQSRHLS